MMVLHLKLFCLLFIQQIFRLHEWVRSYFSFSFPFSLFSLLRGWKHQAEEFYIFRCSTRAKLHIIAGQFRHRHCFDFASLHRHQFCKQSAVSWWWISLFCFHHLKKTFVFKGRTWAHGHSRDTPHRACACFLHVCFAAGSGYLIWLVIMIKMGDNEKRSDIIKCT